MAPSLRNPPPPWQVRIHHARPRAPSPGKKPPLSNASAGPDPRSRESAARSESGCASATRSRTPGGFKSQVPGEWREDGCGYRLEVRTEPDRWPTPTSPSNKETGWSASTRRGGVWRRSVGDWGGTRRRSCRRERVSGQGIRPGKHLSSMAPIKPPCLAARAAHPLRQRRRPHGRRQFLLPTAVGRMALPILFRGGGWGVGAWIEPGARAPARAPGAASTTPPPGRRSGRARAGRP